MSHPTVEQLRPVDLFDGIDDEALARFASAAEVREVETGTPLITAGDAPRFHLVLEGKLEATLVDAAGRAQPTGEHVAPTWIGAIPVVTKGAMAVTMRALTPVTVAEIEAGPFVDLVLGTRPVFDRIMSQVRPVVSRITANEQNAERLASLGTMAAGLAHELNNPASAAQRAAADLADALDVLSSTIGRFVESGIERGEAQELVGFQRQALEGLETRASAEPLSALDQADAEDAVLDVLEDLGVADAHRLAEPLASAGVDEAMLRRVASLAGPATADAVRWITASLAARTLAGDLAESTKRISDLVDAVKRYAFMDQGGPIETDIHEGLDTTLAVLKYKLKHKRIAVERSYDRSLPRIVVRGGELNQVWTNLLHNAIQALGDSGKITVATALDGPCVRVDIGDDGPGIDPSVRDRVFDPFFTTKDVGHGTGLGLDTARRIVVERHRGSISFDSQPGHTVFHVWLPLEAGGSTPSAAAADSTSTSA
jgi:signal transduction histidine kinase